MCVCVCVCVCVCLSVRARVCVCLCVCASLAGEDKRAGTEASSAVSIKFHLVFVCERETERKSEREREWVYQLALLYVCDVCVHVCSCVCL